MRPPPSGPTLKYKCSVFAKDFYPTSRHQMPLNVTRWALKSRKGKDLNTHLLFFKHCCRHTEDCRPHVREKRKVATDQNPPLGVQFILGPRLTWLVLKGVAVRGCSAVEAEQRRNLLRLWSRQAESSPSSSSASQKKRPTHWSAARGGFSGPIFFFFFGPRTDEKWTIRTPCVWIILGFYLNCYSSHTLDNCILQIVIYLSINHVIMKFLWSFNK